MDKQKVSSAAISLLPSTTLSKVFSLFIFTGCRQGVQPSRLQGQSVQLRLMLWTGSCLLGPHFWLPSHILPTSPAVIPSSFNLLLVSLGFVVCVWLTKGELCRHIAPTFNDSFKSSFSFLVTCASHHNLHRVQRMLDKRT